MVSPEKWQKIRLRMAQLGIQESELYESFIRSSGHGGQNVNKTNTCVYLRHEPTEIEVKCQQTRSQIDNRYFARSILCDKIEAQLLGKKSAKEREIFKLRKQKKRRSKRAKEKMIQAKRDRSQLKSLRKNPSHDES